MAAPNVKMCVIFVSFAVIVLLSYSVSANGLTVQAEGSTAVERMEDVKLTCDAIGLNSDDELVRITWYAVDQSHRIVSEIFSADLTNDQPAFVFSSHWAGRGTFEPGSVANIRLPARHVTRDFTGSYRCQVTSLMTTGFADVSITVLYGPGSSIVISPGGRVERKEGEELIFRCSSQCKPVCSYRWYRAGRQVANTSTLVVTRLTRDQAGLYACQARNEAGRSIKPVDLRISYPATILTLNASGTAIDAHRSTIGKKEQTESNEKVIFTCEVMGWPEPKIDWIKNGVVDVAISNANFVSTQMNLEVKSSKFEIKSATCRDNGEYTCKAGNNIGNSSSKSVILNIQCSPIETNFSEICYHDSEMKFIIKLHERLHFKICFFGNPTPNATLSQINEKSEILKTYTGNITCDINMNQCESLFDLNITSPNQYGPYKIKVDNSRGYFEKNCMITSQQPPLLPSIFSVANISHNSVCLSWKPNFNGGSRQTFKIKIYSLTKQTQQNAEEAKVLYVEENKIRTSVEDVFVYSICIADLIPSTLYEVELSTSNKFGTTETSIRNRFITQNSINFTIPIPSWLSIKKESELPPTSEIAPTLPSTSTHNSITGTSTLNKKFNFGITPLPSLKKTLSPAQRITLLNDPNRHIVGITPKSPFITTPNYSTKKVKLKGTGTKEPHVHLEDDSEEDDDDDEDNNDSKIVLSNLNHDSSENKLSRLLDAYLPLNRNNKLIPTIAGNKSAKLSTKYATHMQRIFLNYATAQNQLLPPDPNQDPVVDYDVTTSTSLAEASPTTLPQKPTRTSTYPATVSTILVVSACVLGIVITCAAITFIKRNNHLQRCPQTPPARTNNQREHPSNEGSTQPHGTRNAGTPLRVPPFTCVYNENPSFSPQTARRPRLSTPDRKLFRTKEPPTNLSRTVNHSLDNPGQLRCDSENPTDYEIPTIPKGEVLAAFNEDVSTVLCRHFSSLPNQDTSTSFCDLPPGLHRDPPSSLHRDLPLGLHSNPPLSLHRDPPPSLYRDPPSSLHRDPPPGPHRDPPPSLHRDPPPGPHRDPPSSLHRDPPPGLHRVPPSSPNHERPSTLKADLPTITFQSSIRQCPSYLELHHDENELPLQTNNINQPPHPSTTQLDQHPYLIPLTSNSSTASQHETYPKNLTDQDPDIYTSYLDLYETLTFRSRSRSPSNIYDPFQCDPTGHYYPHYYHPDVIDVKNGDNCSSNYLNDFSLPDNQFVSHVSQNVSQDLSHVSEYLSPVSEYLSPISQNVSLAQENRKTENVSAIDVTKCVELRPKTTPPRPQNKLTRPPMTTILGGPPKQDGPYVLIDQVSRKHFVSRVCLPKISKSEHTLPERFPNNNQKNISNFPTNNEHRINSKTCVNLQRPERNHENKYEYRIPLESKVTNLQNHSDFKSSRKMNAPEISAIDKNINANLTNENFNKNSAFLHDKHRVDTSKIKNMDLTSSTVESVDDLRNNNIDGITEINGYVEEYTISALARDSANEMSNGYCSIYSNESEFRVSNQSNFSNKLDEPRFRKLSSDSSEDSKGSRKFSFGDNSVDDLFIMSEYEYCDSIEDSTPAGKALRDSGVSCSYNRDSRKCKELNVDSRRCNEQERGSRGCKKQYRDSRRCKEQQRDTSGCKEQQLDRKRAFRRRLCDMHVEQVGSSGGDQIVYEEPFVSEPIYSELSS